MEMTEMTWGEMMEAKGRLQALRRILVRQMEVRFSAAPNNVRRIIEDTHSTPLLYELADEVLEADSIDKMAPTIELIEQNERAARAHVAAEIARQPAPPRNAQGLTDAEEYQRLLERPEYQAIKKMEAACAEHFQAEGAIGGLRKLVLRQIYYRFPFFPANLRRKIEEIDSQETLTELAERVLTAGSINEMGLG